MLQLLTFGVQLSCTCARAVTPPLVLEGLTPGVPAAVVTSRSGKQEITFHAAAGPGSALQLPH